MARYAYMFRLKRKYLIKVLYYFGLVAIAILFLPAQTVAQDRWYEKGTDDVHGDFSQGVATDGVDWYFSARSALYKTNFDYNFLIVNENPIPQFLQDQTYNHVGDIAYYEGKLYAPIEDASYDKPIIALYDAITLEFTGEYAEVPQSHIPWVGVDTQTGLFYSSEFDSVNKLFVYDPNQDFALIYEVPLDTTLSRVQGGAFLGDYLYLACDNGDYIYAVDIATGAVSNIIKVPSAHEMEGIEAYDLDSGYLHFVSDTQQSKNVFYHYATPLARDVTIKTIVSPEPNMPIWSIITPVAIAWNIGENTELELSLVCIIDTMGVELYSDRQTIASLPSLVDSTVRFAPWKPEGAGSYNFTFYTELINDLAHHNDTLRQILEVSNILDDFESGLGKWEIKTGWSLSLAGQSNTGTYSLWTTPRPYSNNTDNAVTLISPLDLSGFGQEDSIGLTLWTKNRLEAGKDFMYVEASSGSDIWAIIGSFTGRDADWAESSLSLSSYAGAGNENVHIRFRLVTDTSGTDSGTRIDDVMLATGVSSSVVVSIDDIALPDDIRLAQSYPNPFNPTTTIRYELPHPMQTTLSVYNLSGQEVIRLVDGNMNSGLHEAVWHGRDKSGKLVVSGIYIERLIASGYIETVKMILLK